MRRSGPKAWAVPGRAGFFVYACAEAPAAVADRLRAEGVFTVPLPEGLRVGLCGMRAAEAPRFAQALRNAV